MKSKSMRITVFFLMFVGLCSCQSIIPNTGNNTPLPTNTSTDNNKPIGTVLDIKTQVHAGARDNPVLIEGKTDLGNDDYVSVTDGGKARLEFPGPISLLLFNQSDMDGIKLESDVSSNPRITNRLIRGGFLGYVAPGKQLTVDLAFGVKVNVLGTNFFIVYDEESGFIIIGKFDGTLIVSVPGQADVSLEDSELADITSKRAIRHLSPISFTSSDFEKMADTCNSPIQGLNILRRDNGLPLPGETTADKNVELPCGTTSLLTPSPETPACQTTTATVKANTAYLREGPDLRFKASSQYKTGAQFTVLGRYKDWFQVESPDGEKGWLYKDWLSISSNIDTNSVCLVPEGEVPMIQTQKKDRCQPSYYDLCN
jgi:hypothetical protein